MLKRLLFLAIAACFALAVGFADQSNGKVIIEVNKTNPTDGKQMFISYCAPCHGVNGRGHGPAAAALKLPPTDLTVLAKDNHGKYPDTHVVSVMRFGTGVSAHGSAEMPVWGQIFGKMSKTNSQETDLRTTNLSRYLETLQVK
jgi:mono/diheme cytochrome c family protein